MDKVYVIGGSGFVGTSLCQRLHDSQRKFIIIDIKKSRRFSEQSRIADIRDPDQLSDAFFDINPDDKIVHLAAVHRDDVTDNSLYYETNVKGTENICREASLRGVKNIIFTSSVAVYGFAPLGTDENGEINPFNEYGRTKYMAEKALEAWRSESAERRTLTIRPTVIFGPGNRGNVYNLLKQINSGKFLMVGDGKNKKSMAYVENVSEFILSATNYDGDSTVVNYVDHPDLDMNSLVSIARGKLRNRADTGIHLPYWLGLTIGYLADFISKVSKRKLPISSIRVRKFCANSAFNSSKNSINSFKAPFSIQEALLITLDAEFKSPDPSMEIFFTE